MARRGGSLLGDDGVGNNTGVAGLLILRRRRRDPGLGALGFFYFFWAAVPFGGFVAHPRSPVWLKQEDPSLATMAQETTLES